MPVLPIDTGWANAAFPAVFHVYGSDLVRQIDAFNGAVAIALPTFESGNGRRRSGGSYDGDQLTIGDQTDGATPPTCVGYGFEVNVTHDRASGRRRRVNRCTLHPLGTGVR